MSLRRPLAIFFVIALVLAATSRQPVQAASRESVSRHSAAAAQPQRVRAERTRRTVSHTTRSSRTRASRHAQATEHTVSSHGQHRVTNSSRRTAGLSVATRSSRTRHASLEKVSASRPSATPMVRPFAGAGSVIEAAPKATYAGRESHASTEVAANAAGSLSAEEIGQAAIAPRVFPMYTRAGRLMVPPPLRGTHEILVHQNQMADAAGLERIENDEELDRLRYSHQLIEVDSTSALRVNPELPENRRFARPWTAKFATDIAHAYYARFGRPLELNSAVRTISYQLRLQRVNGNAADIAGETASPHLTGQAVDFGKKGMTMAEIAWMRMYLAPLMNAGMIDVEEEFHQACFHISVYRSYTGTRPPDVAQARRQAGTSGSPSSPDDLDP